MATHFPKLTGGESSKMFDALTEASLSLQGSPSNAVIAKALRVVIGILIRLVWH